MRSLRTSHLESRYSLGSRYLLELDDGWRAIVCGELVNGRDRWCVANSWRHTILAVSSVGGGGSE
jgi:hypothetical protein